MGSGAELGSGPEYHVTLVTGYLPRPEPLTRPFFRDAKVVFEIEKEEMEWQARPPGHVWPVRYPRSSKAK